MLHAGLDLSRKKIDVCLLSAAGESGSAALADSAHELRPRITCRRRRRTYACRQVARSATPDRR